MKPLIPEEIALQPRQLYGCLVQTDRDITTNSGSQVDLSFEVELDTDHQCGSLQVAVLVGCSFEETACPGFVSQGWVVYLGESYQLAVTDCQSWVGEEVLMFLRRL